MVRVCGECQAKVTVLGRTGGVLCNSGSCPFPRLGPDPRAAVGEPGSRAGWRYQPGEGE